MDCYLKIKIIDIYFLSNIIKKDKKIVPLRRLIYIITRKRYYIFDRNIMKKILHKHVELLNSENYSF